MNQLDATVIYWSVRSAQHVSGNILPIIRSVRLRFLQHMASCCCGGKETVCHAAAHRLPAHHNSRIPYAVKISVSRSWWWAKYCPTHVELILQINKSLLHLVGSSVLLYLIDDARSNKNQIIDKKRAKYVKYILKFITSQKKITLTGSFIFSTSWKVVMEDILMWRALCRLNHQHLILLQE